MNSSLISSAEAPAAESSGVIPAADKAKAAVEEATTTTSQAETTEAAAITTETVVTEVKKKLLRGNSLDHDSDLKYDGDVDDQLYRSMPDMSYRLSKSSRPEYSSHSQLAEDMEIDMDLYLPPGRINATSGPLRLSGQISSQHMRSSEFQIPPPPQIAPPSPRSRSRSPLISRSCGLSEKATTTTQDGNSSMSSLEELFDQDILYDSAGRIDLDVPAIVSHRKLHNSTACHLASVNERLSEDTLEDVHAFSDAAPVRSSNASRVSVATEKDQELLLEPLDELDEEAVDDEEDIDTEAQTLPTVILTNMENLKIQQGGDDEGSLRPRAGMSHVCESISEAISEAPSSIA